MKEPQQKANRYDASIHLPVNIKDLSGGELTAHLQKLLSIADNDYHDWDGVNGVKEGLHAAIIQCFAELQSRWLLSGF